MDQLPPGRSRKSQLDLRRGERERRLQCPVQDQRWRNELDPLRHLLFSGMGVYFDRDGTGPGRFEHCLPGETTTRWRWRRVLVQEC